MVSIPTTLLNILWGVDMILTNSGRKMEMGLQYPKVPLTLVKHKPKKYADIA